MAGEVASIEFRLLGPPEAVAGGRVVAIGGLQQRAVLMALLLARSSAVAEDQVIDVAAIVLGDDQPETAALAIGVAGCLRCALGEPADPAFLLGEALEAATERIRDRLGADGFAQQKSRGANLPADEALAFVAGRLGGGG